MRVDRSLHRLVTLYHLYQSKEPPLTNSPSGDPCESELDCDGDLTCNSRGECAVNTTAAPPRPTTTSRSPPRFTPTTSARTTARPTPTRAPPPVTCEWEGHCQGDACETYDDCDGDLTCTGGRCAPPVGSSTLATSTTRRIPGIPTSTRRVPVPTTTSTRRIPVPPVPTSTRRVTPPVPTTRVTRTTSIRVPVPTPTPTSTRAPPPPVVACGDNPLACIGTCC